MTMIAATPDAALMPTIMTRWARERPDQTALTILDDDLDVIGQMSFAELDHAARRDGARLVDAGAAGQPVLLPSEPTVEFVAALLGCFYAGAIAVPASVQLRRYGRDRLKGIIADANTRFGFATGPASVHIAHAHDELIWLGSGGSKAPIDFTLPGPESPAVLQYTSGSTGSPRGVVVTHRNLAANLSVLREVFAVDLDSRILNWLPLFHDMGLVGGLLNAVHTGSHCFLMRPIAFLRRPLHWLRAIDRYGITISGAPNFAYDLCFRRAKDTTELDLDLSRWKVAFCGAEPVRQNTMERFADTFASAGLKPEVLYPCYGLAEATLIVSGGRLGEGVRTIDHAPRGGTPATFVSCGRPLPAGSVAIVDPETGIRVGEGEEGEIWVMGDHVAVGYWNANDPAAFGNTLSGAHDSSVYLRTGDLGFLRDGELVVSGRLKDVIIYRGEKLHAQDIETTIVESHLGFGPVGAAFSIDKDAAEQIVVAFEASDIRRLEDEGAEMLDRALRAVAEAHGVRLFDLVLVRPGSLPRTTSGKVQRGVARDLYLSNRLKLAKSFDLHRSLGVDGAKVPDTRRQVS